MIKIALYGWYDTKERVFRVSRYPADAVVRPSLPLNSVADVKEFQRRKRATIHWFPPLPSDIERNLNAPQR